VTGVGVEVGLERVLGALLQVVVLADELLELGLDVDDLLSWELEFDDGDTSSLEVGQEADFVGLSYVLVVNNACVIKMSLPGGRVSFVPWRQCLEQFVLHDECSRECCPEGQTGQ
jgi:hypothetical protein